MTNMKNRLWLAGLFILPAFAFADVENDVRCREIAFSQSVENQDAEAFASFIDADARFVGGSVQRGAEAIVAAWSVFFGESAPEILWRPQFTEVLEDGTLALSRGPYRMITVDADGATSEHWGTFNSIWRKQQDDSWKIIFDAGNDAAAPPPDDVQALLSMEVDCE
jgi:ketosteroid isomerase-like protein